MLTFVPDTEILGDFWCFRALSSGRFLLSSVGPCPQALPGDRPVAPVRVTLRFLCPKDIEELGVTSLPQFPAANLRGEC